MTQLAVAVSGGVDSLCALLRLREQGHDVLALHGLFLPDAASSGLRPAPEGPRLLTAAEALAAPLPPASRQAVEGLQTACGQLGIPLHVADMRAVFDREVVTPFVRAYARGRTPNPCALCNRAIKFGALLDAALSLGADRIATGHYARLLDGPAGPVLAAADDLAKDQSYFLYMLGQNALEKAMFPVGHLTKAQVREIAEEAGLANSRKKDSTGVCFIGERHFKPFLQQFLPAQPGNMRTLEGKVVGRHDGLMYYTLGQRRGLGIGGAGNGERWFVLAKDMEHNELIVTQGADHPLLYSKNAMGTDATWIFGEAPADEFDCTCKYRYRQPDQAVHVSVRENGQVLVTAKERQRAVTPGQSMVFYQGAVCLGGAICDTVLDAGQVG